MIFEPEITAMGRTITRRFLRQRFWLATLALLVSLATSVGIVVVVLKWHAARSDYFLTFHDLGNDVMRLELELLRLSILVDGEAVDRSASRAAFVDLLAGFRTINASDMSNDSTDVSGNMGNLRDHLDELDAEFRVDAALAARPWKLGDVSMPTALQKLRDRDEVTANGEVTLALESEISRLLRLTVPLARGDGGLNAAEREVVENVSLDRIRPILISMMDNLDVEVDRSGQMVILIVLVLPGLGIAVALLSFAAIFRPLERTIMASQVEIISERDKAVAADIAKRIFLSSVSHELRTPMNGVLGFAGLLIASDLKSARA